ncbi:MAG TPA: helix-turn-helix transcriptional regulator [Mycobacteriales bacterium]|nr:helix-turn-helix transcriptional regulator [Mycobacteriales bacterium]
MLFRDLSGGSSPVASLRDVTDDRPVRSTRFREFLAPQGYDDELRAAFKVGDTTWGSAGLYLLHHGFPPSIIALVARARAVAEGHENGPARLRLRGRNGQWLVLHASCMGEASAGTVAVIIEPAKSSEIAPIIVEAYALSPRERDVVRAITRGLSGPEIATELFLSPHTVRDYVKSVFEKVGVSSRGELVAKLFADHYSDALHNNATHVA